MYPGNFRPPPTSAQPSLGSMQMPDAAMYAQPQPPMYAQQPFQQAHPQHYPQPPMQQYQQQPMQQFQPQHLAQGYGAPPGSYPRGNKKSLLVGINYFRQRSELKGCINDVHNMRNFISQRYGFPQDGQHMIVLTDDQQDPNFQPTRNNLINAMRWLVGGAVAGDSLMFHYSGHGGEVPDRDGDEADGKDSCIYPVDFQKFGPIIDDELNAVMVRHLPAGVRLTVIFDCCHSGTGLDLPYTYNHDGTLKRYNPGKEIASAVMSVGVGGRGVNLEKVLGGVMSVLSGNGQRAETKSQQTRSSMADVVMFSGCKDTQTSADTFVGGYGATGAMSYAFIQALTQQPQQSYLSLLQNVRAILHAKYQQKPQLSSGKQMNMQSPFLI